MQTLQGQGPEVDNWVQFKCQLTQLPHNRMAQKTNEAMRNVSPSSENTYVLIYSPVNIFIITVDASHVSLRNNIPG